jgi:hypothetical protein
MVRRHQSFAGHSLANVGFAGATGAALFGITPAVGLFVAGLLAGGGIQASNVTTQQKHQSDSAIGAILTASLALGFLFIPLSPAAYAASVSTLPPRPSSSSLSFSGVPHHYSLPPSIQMSQRHMACRYTRSLSDTSSS